MGRELLVGGVGAETSASSPKALIDQGVVPGQRGLQWQEVLVLSRVKRNVRL